MQFWHWICLLCVCRRWDFKILDSRWRCLNMIVCNPCVLLFACRPSGMRPTDFLCLACEFRVAINEQFDMTTVCKFQYLQKNCLLSLLILWLCRATLVCRCWAPTSKRLLRKGLQTIMFRQRNQGSKLVKSYHLHKHTRWIQGQKYVKNMPENNQTTFYALR